MKSSKLLIEERGEAIEQLEALVELGKNEQRNLSDDENKEYDTLTDSIEKLDADIQRAKKLEDILKRDAVTYGKKLNNLSPNESANFGQSRATKPDVKTVWRSVKGEHIPVYSPSQRLLSANEEPEMHIGHIARMLMYGARTDEEKRALGEGINPDGGYTVPEILTKSFVDSFRAKSRINQAGASTIGLTSDNLSMVKLISDPIPKWRPEHGEVAEGKPAFGVIKWEPKSLAVHVPVSWEVLQDGVNLEEMLRRSLTEAMANEIDRVAIYGTGLDNEPRGLVNIPGVGFYSMGANGGNIANYKPITQGINILMNGNVDPNNVSAIMNPRDFTTFSELTATDGQPLNRPDLIKNVTFFQTKKVDIEETQGTAENASTIVLGDFSDLVYGIRSGIKLEFMRYGRWKTMEAVFLIHCRIDVAVLHEESFCLIRGITPNS